MRPAISQSGSKPVSLQAEGRSFHSSATCSAKPDGGASSSDEEKWESDEELVLGLDEVGSSLLLTLWRQQHMCDYELAAAASTAHL